MSTANPSNESTDPDRERSIKLISRSPVCFWWPVWAVGFLMPFLTYWDSYRMDLVLTARLQNAIAK